MALFPLTMPFYWSHWSAGSALPVIRGSTGQFLPIICSNQKKKGPKFHVTHDFYSRESEALFTSAPLNMVMHPPPTLACFISPLRVGIGTFLNIGAYHLPRGVPSCWPNFLFHSHGGARSCKPHRLMIFSASTGQIALARLQSCKKSASTRRPTERVTCTLLENTGMLVYCCLALAG